MLSVWESLFGVGTLASNESRKQDRGVRLSQHLQLGLSQAQSHRHGPARPVVHYEVARVAAILRQIRAHAGRQFVRQDVQPALQLSRIASLLE